MYTISYRVTAESPLILALTKGERNLVETLKYIPGTSIIGLLTSQYIKCSPSLQAYQADNDDKFHKTFLSGDLVVNNAHLVVRDLQGTGFVHLPVPVSIRKKKHSEDEIFDLLYVPDSFSEQTKALDTFCCFDAYYHLSLTALDNLARQGLPEEVYDELAQEFEGQEASSAEEFLDALSESFEEEELASYQEMILKAAVQYRLRTKKVETNLQAHHARDRDTGTTKDSDLFTYESILRGQAFEGCICGSKDNIQHVIDTCGVKWDAFIGRSRNAQYGKATFEFLAEKPDIYQVNIPSKPKISLTLLADTIIYNDEGFSTTDIHALEKYLGKGVCVKKAFIKKGKAESFVGIWGLKKPSESCFAAGSSFLLEVPDESRAKLNDFQMKGIGERTNEGFGHCVFGWQPGERLQQIDLDKLKETEPEKHKRLAKLKPSGDLPDETRRIFETLARQAFEQYAEGFGREEQLEFGNAAKTLTPSLIARIEAMSASLSKSDFIDAIKSLRKTAREKLEHCIHKKKHITLFEFLTAQTDLKTTPNRILQESDGGILRLKQFCQEIAYAPEEDERLKHLDVIYWTAFFTRLRKRVQTGKEES